MEIKPGVTCCPFCKSGEGFNTTMTMRETRVNSWDGQGEGGGDITIIKETNPRCINCRRSLRTVVSL